MSDMPAELPLLIGPGHGEPETLMLISAPDASGAVRTRRWTAADWSAPPATIEMSAHALFTWLEQVHRQNRTLNQSLTQLRSWLHQ